MSTVYFAPIIFFFIAFVFSMLGMGGSQLYIPILFWLGMDFKTQAIPLGMLLNVVNSSSAAFVYARKKLVDWRVAIPFGITMVTFAPLGTLVNINLPTKPVILIFAIFTATAAILMLSGWKPKAGKLSNRARLILGICAGGALGFFAGLIGRGGGSFVVPLLYIAGLTPKAAAATSAMVVTFSGSSSFLSHILTAAQPNWLLWILCVLAVFLGSQAGSRLMAKKLKSKAVRLIFGIVLLFVAAILIIKDVL
ncbi:MAG: sulfite exporter TauE/SafE family protein [Candidatus Omnitrophota bacterium]|nr:MAG: sulfite exporter TauE/SafE family protein [Candidatus Omnitrophota bacterium]